jgi:hypothetical protein
MRKNYFKRDFIHNFGGHFFKLFHNRQSCPTVAVKFDTGDTAWMIVSTCINHDAWSRFFLRWNGR